jgi:transitional endoplasmic reticulum ATPase
MSLLNQMQQMDQEARLKEQRRDIGIKREGTQIVLPEGMTISQGIEHLQRKMKDEETLIAIHEEIVAFPFDGAFAFMKALKEIYGWASPVPTPTFFGPKPPITVQIEVDYGRSAQIIWGDFKVPGIEGILSTSISKKNGRLIFKIGGEVKKKFQSDVATIAERTRQIVKRESIYKGKAFKIRTNDKGELDQNHPPTFIDLTNVHADELTFSDEVMAQVQTNFFTPIEHTAACLKNGIPLKRGILLEGPYGTGKTLTAFVGAKKAKDHGWTFVLIERVGALPQALDLARMYQPSVVFAEDIDRAVEGQTRTVEIDDVLNTIDGLESKGTQVITVLTSNHAANINKAMLRPGRLDAIISVQAPDAKAVEKLIRLYARDSLEENTELVSAGRELQGQIPAVIREVVERSKLYAIGRAQGNEFKLTGEDIAHSARGMKNHLELLNPSKETIKTVEEQLGWSMSNVIAKVVKKEGSFAGMELLATVDKNVKEIKDELNN